jgi:hypothetical protein
MTTEEKLELLFAKVRALPKERQQQAVIALSEIAEDDVNVLSDEELAILEPALERAKRGEFASDAEVDEVLNKPWSRSCAGIHARFRIFEIFADTLQLPAR